MRTGWGAEKGVGKLIEHQPTSVFAAEDDTRQLTALPKIKNSADLNEARGYQRAHRPEWCSATTYGATAQNNEPISNILRSHRRELGTGEYDGNESAYTTAAM